MNSIQNFLYNNIKFISLEMMTLSLFIHSYKWSTYICDRLKIPYDLTLTTASLGFRINIMVLMTILLLISIYYITKMVADILYTVCP